MSKSALLSFTRCCCGSFLVMRVAWNSAVSNWIGFTHVLVPHVLFNADIAASAPSHRTRVGTGSTNDESGITQGIGDSETISYITLYLRIADMIIVQQQFMT